MLDALLACRTIIQNMDRDLERKLESQKDFRKETSQAAEEIIFRSFPAKQLSKIIELTKLIETTRDPESPFHNSHTTHSTDTTIYPPTEQLQSTKKRRLENGVTNVDGTEIVADIQSARFPSRVLANKHLVEKVYGVVKGEAEELAALVDKVKLWVTLTMPKIEDGDNFGVQIQEEVLSELCRSQESAYNMRDSTRQGHIARAKLCSKLIKYPNVEDYKLALLEHDEKQFYLARQHLHDLRNVYAIITDLMHKNISKIRAPKANNSVGLY